jgi:hypothetical protein
MKLIAGLVGLFALGMAGAAAAALAAKQRIVPIDDPEADEVALVAIFAPVMFHSTATAFRGGTLDCWYGGGIVDLRDATLDPAGAHLEVKAVFGGAQILVPSSWRVESSVSGVGAMSAPFGAASTWCTPCPSSCASVITSRGLP